MIRFPMRRSLHTFAGGVLLASTALAPVAGAKAPPVSDSVAVPMPPTPAGSAPGNLLGQPIAADDGTAQTVHPGTPVAKDWWLAFRSPAINGLVDRALTANADLIAAKARLAQAQALVGVARGALLPQLDAGLTSERQRLSRSLSTPLANPDPQVFSLHTAQASVSYSPDLFGGGAARVRSAKAAASAAGGLTRSRTKVRSSGPGECRTVTSAVGSWRIARITSFSAPADAASRPAFTASSWRAR